MNYNYSENMKFKEGDNAKYRGMRGGRVGGAVRALGITPEERSSNVRKAAEARWAVRGTITEPSGSEDLRINEAICENGENS